MSAYSTKHLTREEAEKLYVEFKTKSAMRKLRAEAVMMDDEELVDILDEITTDSLTNYVISDCEW
jgi:hypothetical protein